MIIIQNFGAFWQKRKRLCTYSPHHSLWDEKYGKAMCHAASHVLERNNVLGARSPASSMEAMADGEDGGKKEHKYYNNHHQYYAFSIYKVWCQSEYSWEWPLSLCNRDIWPKYSFLSTNMNHNHKNKIVKLWYLCPAVFKWCAKRDRKYFDKMLFNGKKEGNFQCQPGLIKEGGVV